MIRPKAQRHRLLISLAAIVLAAAACSSADSTPSADDRSGDQTDAAASTGAGSDSEATQTDDDAQPAGEAADDGADWTVMVYVMGDNDLEPFAIQDLLEMSAVGSTDRVNIVALVDRHPAYINEAVGPVEEFEDTRSLYIGPESIESSSELGELNLGDPETLASFIEAGVSDYPAEHYAVVLWNHGAPWTGMGPDESNGSDILDLAEINAGFTEGLARAGLDSIDLIGFDACLMASYEVATTVADHGDFMLASEELEPGHGWNYEALQRRRSWPGHHRRIRRASPSEQHRRRNHAVSARSPGDGLRGTGPRSAGPAAHGQPNCSGADSCPGPHGLAHVRFQPGSDA